MVHWLQTRLYAPCLWSMFTPAHLSASPQTRLNMNSSSEANGAKNDSVFMGSHRTQATPTRPGQHEFCTCWRMNHMCPALHQILCPEGTISSGSSQYFAQVNTPRSRVFKESRLTAPIWHLLSPNYSDQGQSVFLHDQRGKEQDTGVRKFLTLHRSQYYVLTLDHLPLILHES